MSDPSEEKIIIDKKLLLNIIITIIFTLMLIISTFKLFSGIRSQEPDVVYQLNEEEEIGIRAYISGAVKNPGVYKISNEMVRLDLVDMAGGFAPQVDLEYVHKDINLSESIENENHLYIPFLSDRSSTDTNGSVQNNSSIYSDKININTASTSELEELPGVGEKTAEKIISGRPFSTIEDIKNIEGIGEATFEKFEELISVN